MNKADPDFELLDRISKKSSHTDDRFKIPSPDFVPLKVYDSQDDCVEGLFQHMLKKNDELQWVASRTSLIASRNTPANLEF